MRGHGCNTIMRMDDMKTTTMRRRGWSRAMCFLGALLFSITTGSRSQMATLQATLSLRSVDNVTMPFQNGMPVPSWDKQHRPMVSLAGTWRKQRFNANHDLSLRVRDAAGYAALVAEAAGRFSPSYDDSGWETKTVPAVENVMNGYERTPEAYENGVWYRYQFSIPDSLRGKRALLKFLAVNYVADVWLNGDYLGWHEGGYTPFAFDVSPSIRFDSVNVLAVRVDNIPWNTSHTPNSTYGYRNDIVPYYRCDWFNYTGIMHDVYVEFCNPVSIVRSDVVPLNINGDITATVTVSNKDTLARTVDIAIQVFQAAIDSINISTEYCHQLIGNPVAVSGVTHTLITAMHDSTRVWRAALNIPNPQVWSPRHPNLYILKTTLSQGPVVVDEFVTQFGIRTVGTSGSAFLLNGRPIFMPGIARHEDHPTYGRSLPLSVIYNDLKKIKTFNVALLRTAHYPNNPYTYLLADRLGLAAMEEIPVWWFDTEDVWTIQNQIRHIHTQMWREMVFKDFNRPSVILWSTCNECLAVSGRGTFIANVRNELHSEYPDGRLVTQSAAADRPGAFDGSQAACDVPGWTMYFGIFHGGTYYAGTQLFLQNAHVTHPVQPILDTEFGYWSGETGSSQATQVTVFNFTFLAFSEVAIRDAAGALNPNGFLMGTTWWCAFDWYTSQQSPPGGFQSMGIYHMDRVTPKTVAPVLASSYRPYYENSELTDVQEQQPGTRPFVFDLSQNYPNPFNPVTKIQFSIVNSEFTILRVFDVLGRVVATLVNEELKAGSYEREFDAKGLAGGVYLYRLTAGGKHITRKMLVLK